MCEACRKNLEFSGRVEKCYVSISHMLGLIRITEFKKRKENRNGFLQKKCRCLWDTL